MKNRLGLVVLMWAVLAVLGGVATAQDWQTSDDDAWCRDKGVGVRYCETREATLPAWDDVYAKTVNGSIRVEGWDRDEVRVVARIQVWGTSKKKAHRTAERIRIYANEDGIYAKGPKSGFWGWFKTKRWSVSFRIMVPFDSDVAVRSTNGGLRVEDVNGGINFRTTNGGVKVMNAGGEVEGQTTNGGITVTLRNDNWDGNGIDLHTTNGGIKVALPHDFSGQVDAATTNGGIRVEHPIVIDDKSRRRLKGRIGDGGPTVRARTTNGGVVFSRLRT